MSNTPPCLTESERRELIELVRLADDQSPDAESVARLEELVLSRHDGRQAYVQAVGLISGLHWSFIHDLGLPKRLPRRHFGKASRLIGLAASLLLIGYFAVLSGLLIWDQIRGGAERQHGAAAIENESWAQLKRADDAGWQHESGAKWEPQSPNRYLQVRSGIAELQFAQGVKVVVQGPAEFELRSDHSGFLRRGKLVALVPKQAIGFMIETPTAEVVDLGTEFAVAVDEGGTDVHVFQGRVEVHNSTDNRHVAADQAEPKPLVLSVHESARIEPCGQVQTQVTGDTFVKLRKAILASAPDKGLRYILLSNLFDDPHGALLVDAMRTDTLGAIAETNDLGVNTVIYGGDPMQQIAPAIRFDLGDLGWQNLHAHRTANDSFGDTELVSLRSRGALLPANPAKNEESIGTHANSVITFDLDEIRAAGGFDDRAFEFICDRAGITDHIFGNTASSIHLAVIVSTQDGVQAAMVDGEPVKLTEHDGVWSITSPVGDPIRADGRFVNFRVPISLATKWLTLVTTSAADYHGMDGAVWSGARLNVKPVGAANRAAPDKAENVSPSTKN